LTILFTLEGVEGKLFQPMAISIVLAMMASLMVALMVVPALSTYLFTKGISTAKNTGLPTSLEASRIRKRTPPGLDFSS
jgi:Cu/Ag efflux pump CusA